MSSNALFDEDSSDDEEEEETKEQAKEQQPKKRVIDDDEDNDDDDDDDEEELKDEESTRKSVPKAPKQSAGGDKADGNENESDDDDEINDNDGAKAPKTTEKRVIYNQDEEDVEFDDDGGIVGSAAPVKNSSSEAPAKFRRPKKLTVLDTKHPTSDTTMHITKLPNVVGIQPEPFDVDSFVPEQEEKEYNGYVHNMIRWRYKKDKDGNLVRDADGRLMRESNARLVKWEDGSITLHVGSEVFVVDQRESGSSGYPGLNGYLYLSQKATFAKNDDDDDDHDEQPGGTVLECMGPMVSKLTVRPSSLQSAAHKALTVAVRQKTTKRATIAEYVTQEDPEKIKEERIRQKTDLDKAQARKNTSSSSRHYSSGGTRRTPGMNRRYMEEEDGNYDSVNIRDLKRRNLTADDEMMDYGDDDSDDDNDDDDVGWSKGKLAAMRSNKKRARREVDDDDDGEEEFGVGGDDSDDEELVAQKKPKKAQTNIFDDDDD